MILLEPYRSRASRLQAMRRIVLGAALVGAATAVLAVDAEPSGIADETQAKIARARAKAGTAGLSNNHRPSDTRHDTGAGGQPGLSNCGVNIGNSVNAPRGQQPKEIIVVVKGDVVNANNKCK